VQKKHEESAFSKSLFRLDEKYRAIPTHTTRFEIKRKGKLSLWCMHITASLWKIAALKQAKHFVNFQRPSSLAS